MISWFMIQMIYYDQLPNYFCTLDFQTFTKMFSTIDNSAVNSSSGTFYITDYTQNAGQKRPKVEEEDKENNCGGGVAPPMKRFISILDVPELGAGASQKSDVESAEDEDEEESDKSNSSADSCAPQIARPTPTVQQHIGVLPMPTHHQQMPQPAYNGHHNYAPFGHSTPLVTGPNPPHNMLWNLPNLCWGSPHPMMGPLPPPPHYGLMGQRPASGPMAGNGPYPQMTHFVANPGGAMNPPPATTLVPNLNNYQWHQLTPSGQTSFTTERGQFSNNDSGTGSAIGDKNEAINNESSSGASSADDSAAQHADKQIALMNDVADKFADFPPFVHSVFLNGFQQHFDLEQIHYGDVPARLSLLGNAKKYPVMLAELLRRVSAPECLNTSYLSGILRRAKNKDGGKRLRLELQHFNCGIELQTGRRKSGPITTFTTLCEREALQLAGDFDKLVQEGFPHRQLALEMNKSTLANSPEFALQRLGQVQSASQVLRESIALVEQAIGQETLALGEPQQPGADDTSHMLDQFKRFARLSHCFGNRGILVAWRSLLSVLSECEQSLHQALGINSASGSAGTSSRVQTGLEDSLLVAKIQQKLMQEQLARK